MFNPNLSKYHVSPEIVLINYGFVEDFAGSMRGFDSEFNNEEFNEYNTRLAYERDLHWIPVAINHLVKTYHFGYGNTIDAYDVISLLEDYVTYCFQNAFGELRRNTSYDLRDSGCWDNFEVIKVVYDHVFNKHFPSTGKHLLDTVNSIIASDKFCAMNHVHELMRSDNEYDNKLGHILMNAVNHSPNKYISDISINPTYFCASESCNNEYQSFCYFCVDNNVCIH